MKRIISLLLSILILFTLIPTVFAASDEATEAAHNLHILGLFQGTGQDANGNPIFGLDRVPNRYEAVTMLVRLLGKEDDALSGNWATPFNDVAEWAKPYVGYAYANELVYGTSATTYGGNAKVTASQYVTFVLRALGYDSSTDFQWDKAWELSDKIGLTDGRYTPGTTVFVRGDLAIISESALDCCLKNSSVSLCDKLMQEGVLSESQVGAKGYHPVVDFYDIPAGLGLPQYSANEIQQMIDNELTLDEVAADIATVADFVQYLRIKEFSDTGGDLHFPYNGREWGVNRSARVVFAENKGNCGGTSNLANYILRGDYDEQGYVIEGANQGGHIYNYFLQNGVYYFIDFLEIVDGGDYARRNRMIYQTDTPQEFSDWYIFTRENAGRSETDQFYLIHQCMYAWDGNHVAILWGSTKTLSGKPSMNGLSSEVKDTTIQLYAARPEFETVFKNPPPFSAYPEDAQ